MPSLTSSAPARASSLTRPSVVSAGMVVVDHVTPPLPRMPDAGELMAVDHLVLNIGGGAANTAVDLTRLGVDVAICARVGQDIFGRFATETLVSHGVRVDALWLDPERATSQTLIVNVQGQDRRFIHSLGANSGFSSADLDWVLDSPPKVLHIGYFLILPELDAEGLAQRFARRARRELRPCWTSRPRARETTSSRCAPSCRTPTSLSPIPTRLV